jgi:hypothetical protein
MQSGMIIYLLKYYHKVSQWPETLATAQGPRPRKRLRHKAAPAIYCVSFCAHSALMAGYRSKLEAIPLSGIGR